WPRFRVTRVQAENRRVLLRVDNTSNSPLGGKLTSTALDLIRGDRQDAPVNPNAANYKTLRLRFWFRPTPDLDPAQNPVSGDAVVVGLATEGRGTQGSPYAPLPTLDQSLESGAVPKHIWVVWPADVALPSSAA